MEKNKTFLQTIEKVFVTSTLFLSLVIIFAWATRLELILEIMPRNATMKFNTGLVFLMISINLALGERKGKIISFIYNSLSILTIIIGTLTLFEYIDISIYNIDNIIVEDSYSLRLPGRMSPATAICSILIGFGLIGYKQKNNTYNYICAIGLKISTLLSFTAIISFILAIPQETKSFVFQTMAVHTSVLFFISSLILLSKYPNSHYREIFYGKYSGSKIFKKILPAIILLPIILSYILISLINEELITKEFGIVGYVVFIIPITFIYISFLAINLNKKDYLQHQLENELLKKNKELEQFSYIACHDLQEPLNSIISFSTLLEEEKQNLSELGQKSIDVINKSSNRMKNFVSSLLEFSKIGHEKELKEIDLTNLVKNVKEDLHNLIESKEVKIIYKGPALTIMGYEHNLTKLFQNLIVNGIKYSKKDIAPIITINAKEKGLEYEISITDNGIGIAKEFHDRIFNAFQRLHTQDEVSGTGLGLLHCKAVTEMHKGKIWVKSQLGKGSTFYFTLAKEI